MSARIVVGAWGRGRVRRDVGCDRIEIDVLALTFQRADRVVGFAPRPFRFIAALLAASPERVDHRELDETLWGDLEDGGPEHAQKCKHIYAYSARLGLAGLGVKIVNDHGRGFRADVDVIPVAGPSAMRGLSFRVLSAGCRRPSEVREQVHPLACLTLPGGRARRFSSLSEREGVSP